MRLFIAIDLPKKWIETICRLQEQLKKEFSATSYIDPNNLHLTLRFIGLCDKNKMSQLIDQLEDLSFSFCEVLLKPEKIGFFSRRGGKLLWIGLEKTKELCFLQKEIEQAVQKIGISKDFFDYFPHITIARRAKLPPDTSFERYEEDIPSNFLCTSYGLYETKFLKTGVKYFKRHRFEL